MKKKKILLKQKKDEKSFEELGVSKNLVFSLKKHNILFPTKIQIKAIPFIMQGRDVMAQSETGSGKTLSFAIPIIENLSHNSQIKALIIAPTRELAKQITTEFIKFGKFKNLITTSVYGGVSLENQARKIKTSDIIVGTPGRLLDLINRGMMDLSYVKYLVLDEADRMLDMGFIEDIDKILRFIPKKKQTLMFSATINGKIIDLMEKYLCNPKKIMLENQIKKEILKQVYYNVPENKKLSLLIPILKERKNELTLIFCNTKRKTRFVADALRLNGISASCLNGDMTQPKRERTINDFASGRIKVLVATDVAARGLDIENIKTVINYDLHDELETYTHRIGRTGRQGRKGTAIILLCDKDYWKMDRIITKYRNKIEEAEARFERIKIPKKTFSRRTNRNFNRNFKKNSFRKTKKH